MLHCSNCGSEIEEDGNFCGKCGIPTGNQGEAYVQTQNSTTNSFAQDKLSLYFKEIKEVAQNMLFKPISFVNEVPKKLSKEASCILAFIMTILYSVVNLWIIKASITNFSAQMKGTMGREVSMGFSMFEGMLQNIDSMIPYPKLFVTFIFEFLIIVAVIALIPFLMGKYLFKKDVQLSGVYTVSLCVQIPVLAAILVQALVSYISVKLGIAIFFIGFIISLIALYEGLDKEFSSSKEQRAFLIPIMYLIILIISTVLLKGLLN